ncbi:hypothetical protein CALCODRAFT_56671 [Calocera cornea HHB12733]|uniref:Uncharacterized protein n=1 Tax=Calocera cornea HHB12733 TaxID=1353952 RepID=A0A165DPL8_9BASI|nr:hypothetical protein CALCODRAFT_56671 [Calocera cornea HHB12733]
MSKHTPPHVSIRATVSVMPPLMEALEHCLQGHLVSVERRELNDHPEHMLRILLQTPPPSKKTCSDLLCHNVLPEPSNG